MNEKIIKCLVKIQYSICELIEELKNEEVKECVDVYTVNSFAKLIGCTPKTVYSLIKRNELQTEKRKIRGRRMNYIAASNSEIKQLKTIYTK